MGADRTKKRNIGDVYDVWWELIEIIKPENHHYKYILRNKANGMVATLTDLEMRKLENGTGKVSYSVSKKIRKERWGF